MKSSIIASLVSMVFADRNNQVLSVEFLFKGEHNLPTLAGVVSTRIKIILTRLDKVDFVLKYGDNDHRCPDIAYKMSENGKRLILETSKTLTCLGFTDLVVDVDEVVIDNEPEQTQDEPWYIHQGSVDTAFLRIRMEKFTRNLV